MENETSSLITTKSREHHDIVTLNPGTNPDDISSCEYYNLSIWAQRRPNRDSEEDYCIRQEQSKPNGMINDLFVTFRREVSASRMEVMTVEERRKKLNN